MYPLSISFRIYIPETRQWNSYSKKIILSTYFSWAISSIKLCRAFETLWRKLDRQNNNWTAYLFGVPFMYLSFRSNWN